MNIGALSVGGDAPCRIVAEVSNAHNGSFDRAVHLIDEIREAGADFVKFQCYTPDELVTLRGDGPAPEPWGARGWTMRTLYVKAQTPHAWFPELVAHCNRIGLPWFSSVFGPASLALLESLDCPAYKIARLDNKCGWLIEMAGALRKPLIVSEAQFCESRPASVRAPIRLHCPPGYPQKNVVFERTSSILDEGGDGDMYDCVSRGTFAGQDNDRFDGLSYHGTDPFPCVVAAVLGAKMIEAHIQPDDEPSELEANVSLTASRFAQMVREVRRAEVMIR
jgi:sialic acid synthase SpsE